MKSTPTQYGRVAQLLHWLSALLILFLIPMGFLMQTVDEGARLSLYRTHVILGILVLGLTLVRLGWRWFDSPPEPPSNLAGTGLLAYRTIHWLLYPALLVLTKNQRPPPPPHHRKKMATTVPGLLSPPR